MRLVLSPILGVVSITTAYDIVARASKAAYFPYVVVALSTAGMVLFVMQTRHAPTPSVWIPIQHESVMAGSVVALSLAPLFWRSGRFSTGEFVFYPQRSPKTSLIVDQSLTRPSPISATGPAEYQEAKVFCDSHFALVEVNVQSRSESAFKKFSQPGRCPKLRNRFEFLEGRGDVLRVEVQVVYLPH